MATRTRATSTALRRGVHGPSSRPSSYPRCSAAPGRPWVYASAMLDVRIVEAPARTLVGLEAKFRHALSDASNAATTIPPLWDTFGPRIAEIGTRSDPVCYGLITGDPLEQRAHPDELRYLACVPVRAGAVAPEGMVSRVVPAGTFAAFTLVGPIREIGTHCRTIYESWLPASPYRHAGIADLELYDARFDPESAESVIEYWISIEPRPA